MYNFCRSCYSLFHNNKVSYHDRRSEVASKPSSLRLFRGTNEFAEDLTGQRLPLRAFAWVSETKVAGSNQLAKFVYIILLGHQ